MEQIVRPFQSIDPTANRRIVAGPPAPPPTPATLCWGTAGTIAMGIIQADNFDGVNFRLEECDEHFGEAERDTEDLRIENPDDSSQYVIDRRIRRIKFKKSKKDKFLGVFHTDTTDFGLRDFFGASSSFGDVSQQERCQSVYYLDRG